MIVLHPQLLSSKNTPVAMKRSVALHTLFALAITGLLAGCALQKMEKYQEELGAQMDPSPLIVRGDKVQLNITGTFPEKYFHKKVVGEVTPVLVFDGKEVAFEMKGFQGEDAAGNYEVIPNDKSTSFSYSDEIDFDPAMANGAVLELRIKGSKGNKVAEFAPLEIGLGVRTTPYLMTNDDMPIMSTDNFERVLSYSTDATLNYAYNSARLSSKEMRDDDVKALEAFIAEVAASDSLVLKSASVSAYASPEGTTELNDPLAADRASTARPVLEKSIKKNDIELDLASFISDNPKGEDWEGFKALMEASDIEDKHLIIRVLEMYKEDGKREQEIRNIAATYKAIEKTILPELRRSKIVLNYDVEGYTDEELMTLVKANADILTVEEILFAATLFDGLDDQLAAYQQAERIYPTDYRGINNVGYVLYMQNKKGEAKASFEKAWAVNQAPEVANNMACVTRSDDREAAMDYLNQAGSGQEVSYNKGLIQVQNGDYDAAIGSMGSYNTFNVALVKCLNGDNSGATAALDNSGDDSAMAYYLRAIIAARGNAGSSVISNLTKAIEKDASLKDKAMEDLEFVDFKDQFSF